MDYGSGHIDPLAAINPGLVYEFDSNDIIRFLCSTGASPAQLKNLTGERIYCKNPITSSYNFNYPSIGISKLNGSLSIYRTVTYYGNGPTVYVVHVNSPIDVDVKVIPRELNFTRAGEKKTFRVDLTANRSDGNFVFGDLTWSNGIHRFRSPIVLNVFSVQGRM